MLELTTIQQICVWLLPIILAITIHEASHAWVAYKLGDPTAKQLGRLSFNPRYHIDLVGTIIMPILILVLSQFNFVFGWAKPVPINASKLRNPRQGLALATAAGPLSNLVMAFIWASLLKLAATFINSKLSTVLLFVMLTARAGIIINLLLAFINLIPIPPLDGSRIVAGLLPPRQALQYNKIEPYGMLILLVMMVTGVLGLLVAPPIQWSLFVISSLFNI